MTPEVNIICASHASFVRAGENVNSAVVVDHLKRGRQEPKLGSIHKITETESFGIGKLFFLMSNV
jgi:hypothetical protein